MKTVEELNKAILEITMIIKEDFPELSNYLLEMGETIPNSNHPTMDYKALHDYYNSLASMLREYMPNHTYFIK